MPKGHWLECSGQKSSDGINGPLQAKHDNVLAPPSPPIRTDLEIVDDDDFIPVDNPNITINK